MIKALISDGDGCSPLYLLRVFDLPIVEMAIVSYVINKRTMFCKQSVGGLEEISIAQQM